jgi:uncharacterized protein (TIGR00661 family)
MARILYGVAGEGFGHSSRSELLGEHLIKTGHEVLFAASRKSLAYLQPTFREQIREVYGLSFYYRNGRIHPLRTVLQNLSGYRKGFMTNFRLFSEIASQFRPDLVISDFEPFSAWWAWRNNVPCVSIDHEHLMTCFKFETAQLSWKEQAMAHLVMRGYHTFADAYIVLNFFQASAVNKAAYMVPPVVRRRVLQVAPSVGEHVTVYSTDHSEPTLNHILEICSRRRNQRFFIYGFNRSAEMGNCVLKLTSTDTFLNDLASCRAVVATAGFSLLSECLHFRKPMLLMSIKEQYEQAINAYYVEKLGMGRRTERLTYESLQNFLNHLQTFRFDHPQALLPDNSRYFSHLQTTFAKFGFDLDLN